MLHELYEDMDPDYRSSAFLSKKKLLGSIESPSSLPEYGLQARAMLNTTQLKRVEKIRERRLATVISRFERD